MKKIKNRFIKLFMAICLVFVSVFAFTQANAISVVFAKTNTDSEYVNTITDLKTTNLMGGVTLYEQKMTSLLNGDKQKAFQEHFVQWVDLASYSNANVKLVTWTKQSMDNWTAATTKVCALDWEKIIQVGLLSQEQMEISSVIQETTRKNLQITLWQMAICIVQIMLVDIVV